MYEAFDSFITVDTWHTGHACDDGRFYQALNRVVWFEEFDPQKMAAYLRTKIRCPPEDHTSHFAMAINEYRAHAEVVSDFIRFNELFRSPSEPVPSASSPETREVVLSIFTEADGRLYALEKLTESVDALATGMGPLRERLFEAKTYLMRIRPEQVLEGDLRRTLIGINDDLTFDDPTGDEGRIIATLRGLDDEDATAIARRILDLYSELLRLSLV
jgi:hypothetical protein